MAIRSDGVMAITIDELLGQELRIPHYQRPYVWTPKTAVRLLLDIQDALERQAKHNTKAPYVLGAVILHKNDNHFDIVDGQQRLLTLRVLLRILDGDDTLTAKPDETSPLLKVAGRLRSDVALLDQQERGALARFIRDSCEVVRVVTDDIDEAFRVFDSQNYRGKPLAPHDLLKAHHLREMRNESSTAKAAVVEEWELAGDKALDELFSIYLFRIAKWTRGESPRAFTVQDIDEFKGVTAEQASTPMMRYHLAAQSVLPLMNTWQQSSENGNTRDANRARFQLDAPLLAGKAFFEMTEFMLSELKLLKQGSFPRSAAAGPGGSVITFAHMLDQSRYRRVTELYLASMLYYLNKFSVHDIAAVSGHLFQWAYDLRLQRLRVTQVSVNNMGAAANSPFVLLRHSRDGREVRELSPSGKRYSDDHETQLFALVNGGLA